MSTKDTIRTGATSVEVYRSNDAAPDNWEDAKFWLVNELRRIQSGFFSVDEVISAIGTEDGEVNQVVNNITNVIVNDLSSNPPDSIVGPKGDKGDKGDPGPRGPEGPEGPAGLDGTTRDNIADYKTALDYTWSSDKIAKELAKVGVGGDSSITIGDTPPLSPKVGDLWFDNTYTLELYVWDGAAWVSTTGGSDPSVNVGATAPSSAVEGDLYFDNVNTFDLYVYDGSSWINTDKDHREVYVQRNIPDTNPLKPYLWVQTGMGDDGHGYTLWFNDPEY